METTENKHQLREMQGVLFDSKPYDGKNDKYGRPTTYFAGRIRLFGKEYTLHAHRKYGRKSGNPYLSLSFMEIKTDSSIPDFIENAPYERLPQRYLADD